MNQSSFLTELHAAVRAIREPRFFDTERGYQGELLVQLSRRLEDRQILPKGFIIEQEHQKTSRKHGFRIRPDIIIHIPLRRGIACAEDVGNFAAIEIKRRADRASAIAAFDSLQLLKSKLNYRLTVFLNVDSDETCAHFCPAAIKAQTFCIATKLDDGHVGIASTSRVR